MPIYEYQCQGCGHQFETIQRVTDPVLTQCPSCGLERLKKLLSPVAFRLKGGGWYETDFKSGNKKNVIAEEKSGNGESTKSDAKETKKDDGAKAETKKAGEGAKKTDAGTKGGSSTD